MKKTKYNRAVAILASPIFFWSVLGFFVFESLWIVFTAVYPMAFDEDFHFGLIKLYSHHALPFLSQQPPNSDMFGPVAQNPSYLYHYLMSFPYRFIALFIHSQTLQVISLRLINVALFAYSLYLFRRVMNYAKLSSALTNIALFLFVLVPIVPLLAAQINYDNLTIVLVAWVCLLMQRIIPAIQKKSIRLVDIGLLASLLLLGSIVKYAFLPIAAACVISIVVLAIRSFGLNPKPLWRAVRHDASAVKKVTVIWLILFFIIGLGMFSQRFLVNLADYKTPIPRCEKILTVDQCMSYGPFNRTYLLKQTKSPEFKANVFAYLPQWFYGMWYRMFFAVNGNVLVPWWARYETIPPLKFPSIAGVGLVISSFAVILVYGKRLVRDKYLLFLALMIILYAAALFYDNYGAYARSSQPIAINGRYLLPIALPAAIIAGRAWQLFFAGHSIRLKLAIVGIAAVLLIQGGGVLTYMVNSNSAWYWPDHRVQAAGYYAHELGTKFVIVDTPIYMLPP